MIQLLMEPSGPGIRLDSGVYEGWNVPMDYDPLLAKLIGYGSDRVQAIGRLTRAVGEYFVGGIKNNISLFRRILDDPEFRAGNVDTGFLDRMLKKQNPGQADTKLSAVAVIAAGMFVAMGATVSASDPATAASGSRNNSGKAASGWKGVGRIEALRTKIGSNS
jgi:acetyl-CoA carboxylase biotin carboxylase subunit